MDDSDEYFDESFVLDEQALASIEEVETHFVSTQRNTSYAPFSSRTATNRPASRTNFTKTEQNKPTVVSQSLDPFESDALNVNVRVGQNGAYIIADRNHEPATFNVSKLIPSMTESVATGNRNFEAELVNLQEQLTKLKESNDQMCQALREAQEAQWVKNGEIAMLRTAVETQKQEYLDAVSKAKTDRIAFEKTKAELQTKIKEETERLATNYAFKEFQTSSKVQIRSSARSAKVSKDSQYDGTQTPLRVSRPYNTSLVKDRADNDSDHEAPFSSPSRALSARHRKGGQFKGFKNAFTQSAPVVKSPVKNTHNPFLSSSPAAMTKVPEKDVPINDSTSIDYGNENNVFQVESPVAEPSNEVPANPPFTEDKVDPMEEFQRTVFLHLAPHCDDLTLHSLFSVTFPSDLPPNLVHLYASACNLLLECCSTASFDRSHSHRNWENTAGKIASIFVILGTVLYRAKNLDRLFVLLDLLLQVTLIIPSISVHFLQPLINPVSKSFPDFDQESLMVLFRDIVQTQLIPPPDSPPFGKRHLKIPLKQDLTITILNILGSLYWYGSEGGLESNFSVIFKAEALPILLSVTQGHSVIRRFLQLLIVWASDERLIALFLYQGKSPTDPPPPPNEDGLSSIINQLSVFLAEIVDPQLYDLLHLTFTLINTLSCAHRDIRSSLLESSQLLASAVICITKLTNALWEEKPEVVSQPEVADSALKVLFAGVSSLHHLLFTPETYYDFSSQLLKATGKSRKFNGVVHMFIVTFGRLSWAEAPEWLPPEGRSLCESLSELSMELVEIVVPGGPEYDSLCAVWHEPDSMEDQDILDN